ncbi:MAG: sortase-associated OmpA-like protein PdsO [Pseudohongiellaceae bacterium]
MIKQLSFAIILGAGAGTAWAGSGNTTATYGDNSGVEEATGFVSGVMIGSAVGGPPGVIVGGLIGALLGDGYAAKKRSLDLQANLYETQLQLAAARDEAETARRDYQLALQRAGNNASQNGVRVIQTAMTTRSTPAPACCANPSTSVHFKSGSSIIESHYLEQLESLARISRLMPDAEIEITGYADRRGDAGYNLTLSQQRSKAVKDYFNGTGIQNSSIKTIAYGETRPLEFEQSIENDFFDRRVIIRLRSTGDRLLTSSSEEP